MVSYIISSNKFTRLCIPKRIPALEAKSSFEQLDISIALAKSISLTSLLDDWTLVSKDGAIGTSLESLVILESPS